MRRWWADRKGDHVLQIERVSRDRILAVIAAYLPAGVTISSRRRSAKLKLSGHRSYTLVGAFTPSRLMLARADDKIAFQVRSIFQWCTKVLTDADEWWLLDVTAPVRFDVYLEAGILHARIVSTESGHYFEFPEMWI